MLKIFRTDVFLQIVVIIVASAVIWVKTFMDPLPIYPDSGGQLYYWLTDLLSPLWAAIIAYILILLEGLLLNTILIRHKIINKSTLIPMLFYVLAMSTQTPTLTPILMGNLFVILCIDQLMLTTTLLSITIDKTFGAAACIAMATLFCPAMAVFLVPLIINMINYSLYGWRDWLMVLLGLMAPYILLETYYFVNDELFYRNYLLWFWLSDLHFRMGGNTMDWICSIAFLFILLIGILSAYGNSQNRNINFKKNSTAVMLFTIGSLLFTLYTQFFPVPAQAFAIPFSCCATAIFIESRRKEFGLNILFLATIVLLILWHIL